MHKPEPPPEAALIRLVRLAAHIKTPEAAANAGISTARWSHIENGYETRDGEYKPVTGRAVTIAHMAHAVGITPDRLREAGRDDAARILAEIVRREAELSATPPEAPPPDFVRRHWDDPAVREVWESAVIPYYAKAGMIKLYLERRETGQPASESTA